MKKLLRLVPFASLVILGVALCALLFWGLAKIAEADRRTTDKINAEFFDRLARTTVVVYDPANGPQYFPGSTLHHWFNQNEVRTGETRRYFPKDWRVEEIVEPKAGSR